MNDSIVRITDNVSIPVSELRFRFARSSGAGGQRSRIEAADRLIDRIVYRLYGLTEEEIGVVEGLDR